MTKTKITQNNHTLEMRYTIDLPKKKKNDIHVHVQRFGTKRLVHAKRSVQDLDNSLQDIIIKQEIIFSVKLLK